MRTAITLGVALASVASAAAQEYHSPVPQLPTQIDTTPAQPTQTALPPANTTATAQTPAQTATSPTASAQQK